MNRLLALLALLTWTACDQKLVRVAATQIQLQVDADPVLESRTADVLVSTFVQSGTMWRAGGTFHQPAEAFPLSFSIVPSTDTALNARLEIVVRAFDSSGRPLTELRRVANFVPHEERLLRVTLSDCATSDTPAVCESQQGCHEQCSSCEDGSCQDTPVLQDEQLPALFDALDAAAAADDDRHHDGGDLDAREAPLDAGELDSADSVPDAADLDAADLDAAEGSQLDADKAIDADSLMDTQSGLQDGAHPNIEARPQGDGGDTGADAGPECEDTVRRCFENNVQLCEGGTWKPAQSCAGQACVNAACQGVCVPAAGRCTGLLAAKPELCNAQGAWTAATQEAPESVCPFGCQTGRCVRACSREDSFTCSALHDGQPLQCRAGSLEARPVCTEFCRVDVGCVHASSCGDNPSCGAAQSCCSSRTVPGGTFARSYDGSTDFPVDTFIAHLSPFVLDRFEVTVSRFRKWLSVYDSPGSRPRTGDGKTKDPSDPGWLNEWSALLAANAAELRGLVSSCGSYSSFTELAGANEQLPINCVDWYSALAFCIWDGGRLPTEAEWNFAASAGDQQRVYPWTLPGTAATIDSAHAVFDAAMISVVGSKSPAGDGHFGQADLAGNVHEWVMDIYRTSYATTVCNDCVNLTGSTDRVVRGGAWGRPFQQQKTSYREGLDPYSTLSERSGFRCARAL